MTRQSKVRALRRAGWRLVEGPADGKLCRWYAIRPEKVIEFGPGLKSKKGVWDEIIRIVEHAGDI